MGGEINREQKRGRNDGERGRKREREGWIFLGLFCIAHVDNTKTCAIQNNARISTEIRAIEQTLCSL